VLAIQSVHAKAAMIDHLLSKISGWFKIFTLSAEQFGAAGGGVRVATAVFGMKRPS
jgi:hypothetical protein